MDGTPAIDLICIFWLSVLTVGLIFKPKTTETVKYFNDYEEFISRVDWDDRLPRAMFEKAMNDPECVQAMIKTINAYQLHKGEQVDA